MKCFILFNIEFFVLTKKCSKPMYDILNQTDITPGGKKELSKHFAITEWISIFHLPCTITQDLSTRQNKS